MAGGLATAAVALGCASPASADWLAEEDQLTTGAAVEDGPQVSGNKLVFADHSAERVVGSGSSAVTLFDVRVLDLGSGTTTNLTPGHTAVGRAAISGTRVVWSDYGGGSDAGIMFADLATGRQRRLDAPSGWQPRISGTRVCYEYQGSIHVYNLGTDRDLIVSPVGAAASSCDISGTIVVWQDHRNGHDTDIYSYDLASRRETLVAGGATDQSLPRVDGTLVAWQDQLAATDTDIFAFDLGTGVATRITQDDSQQWFADVADGRVVWMDERNGHDNTEVYLRDVANGVTTRVTEHEGWSGNPTVSGDLIVYEEARGDGHHLYLRRVTPPALSLGLTGDVNGVAPELGGRLLGAGGLPVSEETVVLQTSTDGRQWSAAATAWTSQTGAYIFTVDARPDLQVRVAFVGTPEYPAATSVAIRMPKAPDQAGVRGPLP
jgi:beta propeller repeat protein